MTHAYYIRVDQLIDAVFTRPDIVENFDSDTIFAENAESAMAALWKRKLGGDKDDVSYELDQYDQRVLPKCYLRHGKAPIDALVFVDRSSHTRYLFICYEGED